MKNKKTKTQLIRTYLSVYKLIFRIFKKIFVVFSSLRHCGRSLRRPRTCCGVHKFTTILRLWGRNDSKGNVEKTCYAEQCIKTLQVRPVSASVLNDRILKQVQNDGKCKLAMTANKAFTLIELLVVVVIIGILAAIALPQYRKTISKSRMSEAFTNVSTILESLDMRYLMTSSYSDDLADLDITMPNMTSVTVPESTAKYYKVGNYLYALTNYGSAVISYPSQGPIQFSIEKISAKSTNDYRNRVICAAFGTESVYDDLCKNNFGGKYIGAGTAANGVSKRWYVI
jgi:type IV pilus assembly protein PilE